MERLEQEKTALGIELGSTRIKAVLIGEEHRVLASGAWEWENRLEGGYWSYDLTDAWTGVRAAYRELSVQVERQYGEPLRKVGAMGISGMMHGYLAFDAAGELLTPFRTWRNTTAANAAAELTQEFGFHIPERWSVAHLRQAMQNGEEHLPRVDFLTTLAGYIHWKLTGQRVLGVGEASGMFPIDAQTGDYRADLLQKFQTLPGAQVLSRPLAELLPKVLTAGDPAGVLTEEGAALLDESGQLLSGIPFCPPEGDAGTGMTATNSVACRTGNVSAGTSVFAMIVLERELGEAYREIDEVTTPTGRPVAMVHCNTCTSDLDAWVRLLGEWTQAAGRTLSKGELYELFYRRALEGEPDCGGLVSYNCYAGEPVTGLTAGCPALFRRPDARLTLPNFARAQLYAAMAALKIGMDILVEREGIRVDLLTGHGGLFKTPVVGQKLLAGALETPVSVLETAGEGGPWGMALLAAYRAFRAPGETLEEYLANRVFAKAVCRVEDPDPADVAGFRAFLQRYRDLLPVEQAAAKTLG